MYLLIDNYDSFTYNLYHYFLELGAKIEVYRNDKITPEVILKKNIKELCYRRVLVHQMKQEYVWT